MRFPQGAYIPRSPNRPPASPYRSRLRIFAEGFVSGLAVALLILIWFGSLVAGLLMLHVAILVSNYLWEAMFG